METFPDEQKQNMPINDFSAKKIILAGFIFVLGIAFVFYALYTSVQSEETKTVTIKEGQHREGIVLAVGRELGWPAEEQNAFLLTLRSIQWDAFNYQLAEYLSNNFSWSKQSRELFLIRANLILGTDEDPLAYAFVPKEYTFSSHERPAFVAEALVEEVKTQYADNMNIFFDAVVPEKARERANELARTKLQKDTEPQGVKSGTSTASELLPDLVSLPPQDIAIRHKNGRTHLVFSTTYYNIGKGPLELVGDPEKQGIQEDHERDVFQRVYRADDTYHDKIVGTFEWHQEHLHYHYEDFIDYVLESSNVQQDSDSFIQKQKSTYCVRDISRVDAQGVGEEEAEYRICSKERQGVSAGWGDTYFHTYSDQFFDITDLPSGSYRMAFYVNPAGRLFELNLSNNTSSAVFTIDKDAGTVEITDQTPEEPPSFEHIHTKQDL